jgi:hypothetical protein
MSIIYEPLGFSFNAGFPPAQPYGYAGQKRFVIDFRKQTQDVT